MNMLIMRFDLRFLFLLVAGALGNFVCQAKDFTVADEIALTHFGDPYTDQAEAVIFSPSGNYFVVNTERGLLDRNCPESTLRFYRRHEVEGFLYRPEVSQSPAPFWQIRMCTYKDGPIITHIRWLRDSTGVAFLAKNSSGNDQLFLARIGSRTVEPLTPGELEVTAFDIRDRSHFVYSVVSPGVRTKVSSNRTSVSITVNGQSLNDLMFPEDPNVARYENDKSELWAVVNDKRFHVSEPGGGGPLFIYAEGEKTLALSPNGAFAISALPVKSIPPEWDRLYRPAASSYPRRLPAGPQVLTASNGLFYISVYVLVDLRTGETTPLTSTPAGNAVGWWNSDSQAQWADDGQSVILPNTFVPPASSSETGTQRPCIVVMHLNNKAFNCVEQFKAPTSQGFEKGWRSVQSVHFIGRDAMHIVVSYRLLEGSRRSVTYRLANGGWLPTADQSDNGGGESRAGIAVFVRQSLNDPPVLIVADLNKRISRVLLDPNPQLKGISLGESSIVSFTGAGQLKWFAGLYKPPTFRGDQRYPLVIQTHGFVEDRFDPSGIFPTAFAARALAAQGILVLQVPECPNYGTPAEASCNALRYKAAAEELVAQGLADPHRVGIIGFSRTCFHVLYALTVYPNLFAAASITDGINEGYLQYLASVDQMDNLLAKDYDSMIGAPPFGDGLMLWLAKSPTFNMDKVQTVLQVVAHGRRGLLEMWEPYATLRYLHKPVDFVMLQEGTHVLTNPLQRLASQGGTVDWFRFWLQDEASSEPSKGSQYTRWRQLAAQLSRFGNTSDCQEPLKAIPGSAPAAHATPCLSSGILQNKSAPGRPLGQGP